MRRAAEDDTGAPDISKRRRKTQGPAGENRDRNRDLRNRGRDHIRDVPYRDADSPKRLRDDEQKLRKHKYRESERDEELMKEHYSGSMGDRESRSRRFGKRYYHDHTDEDRARARRVDALYFRSFFAGYRTGRTECIWAHKKVSRPEILCGLTWVAVLGMDSICVVTRKENLEQELIGHVGGKRGSNFLLRIFKNAVICEVEDLAELSGISYENSNQSIKKPFAVVSGILGNNEVDKVSGHEAPSAEYAVDKAIKFLQDEMNSNADFTVDKTIQTAISALQHLLPGRIKANEIRAFVWEKDAAIVKELKQIRQGLDVEEHLAVINALHS